MKIVPNKLLQRTRQQSKHGKMHKDKPMKQENGSDSTQQNKEPNSQSEQTQSADQLKDGSHPVKTCSTLKYGTFIEVYVHGNYARVGGEEAWSDILTEYSNMLQIGLTSELFKLWQKIKFNEWRLVIAANCIGLLRDLYVVKAAEALTEAGFDWVENLEDEVAYQKQLDLIEQSTSSVVVLLNQQIMEHNKHFPKDAAQQLPRTEMDFDKDLAILAKHGYKVNKRKQTVTEYCAAVTAYFEEVKRTKRNGSTV